MTLSSKQTPYIIAATVVLGLTGLALGKGGAEAPAQEAGRTYVMDNLTAQTSTATGSMVVYTVPANKVLVIENLFGRASAVPGNSPYGCLRTKYLGEFIESWVVFDAQVTTSTRTTWTFNHPTKIYCASGSTVEFRCNFKSASPNSSISRSVMPSTIAPHASLPK